MPLSLLLLALLSSCAEPAPAPPQTTALVPAAPVEGEVSHHGKGAVLYVPVYSSVYVAEGDQTFELTVTLSVRNTDRTTPISVTGLRYYDTAGRLLHAYVDKPTVVGPLASADTVVRASDVRAGTGGSFIVEWSAAEDVSDPVVQAIMIGAKYQQGISFVSDGRVLERTDTPPPPR